MDLKFLARNPSLHRLVNDLIILVELSEFVVAHADAFVSKSDDSLPQR